MHPAVRTQVDKKQEKYSETTGLDFSKAKDTARQEHKISTDLNYILDRFGATGQLQMKKGGTYGVMDDQMDLTTAISTIDQARSTFRRAPKHIQEKYGTWERLMTAVESGEYERDLRAYQAEAEKKKASDEAEAKRATPKEEGEPKGESHRDGETRKGSKGGSSKPET